MERPVCYAWYFFIFTFFFPWFSTRSRCGLSGELISPSVKIAPKKRTVTIINLFGNVKQCANNFLNALFDTFLWQRQSPRRSGAATHNCDFAVMLFARKLPYTFTVAKKKHRDTFESVEGSAVNFKFQTTQRYIYPKNSLILKKNAIFIVSPPFWYDFD